VPNLVGGWWDNVGGLTALKVWEDAKFTGTLKNNAGPHQIVGQTLTAGSTVACTSGMSVRQN
jgi:hypothetical protein